MTLANWPRRAGLGMLSMAMAGALAACQKPNPAAAESQPADLPTEQTFCVNEINRYRGTMTLDPLTVSPTIEGFSNNAARVDGEMHEVHHYFLETNGGGGTARAENEIPWWTLDEWSSVHRVIQQGLWQEWTEGPGGSHYENMIGGYSDVACGISVNNGEVTVTQDFH